MDGEMLEYSEAEDLSISARANLTESNLSYRQEEENYEDEGPEDLSGDGPESLGLKVSVESRSQSHPGLPQEMLIPTSHCEARSTMEKMAATEEARYSVEQDRADMEERHHMEEQREVLHSREREVNEQVTPPLDIRPVSDQEEEEGMMEAEEPVDMPMEHTAHSIEAAQ